MMQALNDHFRRVAARQKPSVMARTMHRRVREILDEAEETKYLLRNLLRDVSRLIGYKQNSGSFVVGETKAFDSALAKVVGEYDGDAERLLCDGCRGMLIVEDEDYEALAFASRYFNPVNNPRTRSFTDKILEPTENGFSGLNIKYEMRNEHVAEIIVLTRSMAMVYDDTHDLLRKAENVPAPPPRPGQKRLTYEQGALVKGFNDKARVLHEKANSNCERTLAVYRVEFGRKKRADAGSGLKLLSP